MTNKKNILIVIPMLILLGIATISLLDKNISEVLNEDTGCSSCSGPKSFKAKNKSEK